MPEQDMRLKFLSKDKINDNFLIEIKNQLIEEKQKNRPSEEKGILEKIINNLDNQIDNKSIINNDTDFSILPNEYNFLTQNGKSLWADYLIFRYKFKIYPGIKHLTDFPTHLLVEPVSYCNLKCSICFQADESFTRRPYMGEIDIGLFKDVIDQSVEYNCRALTMASRGEPTLHSKFGELLEYVKDKFYDLKLNTNAMLLDEEKCHQILQGKVTELVFSVDAATKEEYERIRKFGKFEQVLNNIKRFHSIREKEYPESRCKTRVCKVVYGHNYNGEDFLNFWEQFVDNVACIPMQSRLNCYENKPVNRHFPCRILWERIYIWWDGIANPCDYDYKSFLQVGNVRESSIKDIWSGEPFSKLRQMHIKRQRQNLIPCDRCEF